MTPTEYLNRWRLILGNDAETSCGGGLDAAEIRMDKALAALYDNPGEGGSRRGGLGASAPKVSAWLGDIREYFPQSVVQIMQKDAVERLNLTALLTEKEMLENITPDVHLVATLMSLSRVIPEKNKALARQIVQKVVDELMQKLQTPTQQAVQGALNRSIRTRNPRHNEIDWHRTIQKNLKNYQPEYQSIIPEVRIGYGRKRKRAVRDLILCLDQSGSMGTSVIYSGIFGAVLASLPTLQTRMVVFDTSVVDLSEQISDPVELLFGVQLGGGTDIDRALAYCQSLITRPADTTLVLVTDLEEGGNAQRMRQRMAELVASGVQFIVLLALNDDGAPFYDKSHAEYLASLGVPAFACTPDQFPNLMAAALNKQDLSLWVAENVKA
ncbi:MAG: VWA domain-containing protein [Cardiobacterium sp.]